MRRVIVRIRRAVHHKNPAAKLPVRPADRACIPHTGSHSITIHRPLGVIRRDILHQRYRGADPCIVIQRSKINWVSIFIDPSQFKYFSILSFPANIPAKLRGQSQRLSPIQGVFLPQKFPKILPANVCGFIWIKTIRSVKLILFSRSHRLFALRRRSAISIWIGIENQCVGADLR